LWRCPGFDVTVRVTVESSTPVGAFDASKINDLRGGARLAKTRAMRTRQLASSLVTALVLTATASATTLAHADEPIVAQGSTERGGAEVAPIAAVPMAIPAAQVDQTETVWYGYQNLGADGAALVLALGAGAMQENGEVLAWAAFGTYALGSPVIHYLNGGGPGRSLGSVAMRLGLPVAGGFIGMAAVSCDHEGEDCGWDELGGLLIGGTIGVGAAVFIDDFVLAQKERHVVRPMWAPTVAPSAGGGMTFGIAGTF
jgi:hypothetical protein